MHLPLHSELPSAEVEIVPLEGADLTPAQPGGEFQQEEFEASIFLGLDQQSLDFLRGQHLHLPGLGRREAATIGGVAEQEFFRDCLIKCGMEGGVDAPDGLVRKAVTIELRPEESAALLELGVELLDIVGGQFVQLSISQSRDDMLFRVKMRRGETAPKTAN